MRQLPLLMALLLALANTAAHAGLDATERRLAEAIAARQTAALDLLERTVDQNSGTFNLEGVRAVAELYRSELEGLGLNTRWIDGAAFERAGHLVATRGDQGPHFLLIGHLDTVFEPRSAFQSFERISPDHARGPGITDMKGGNVIILEVLRGLQEVGVLDEIRVTVFLAGDEERVGRPIAAARGVLEQAADAADWALGFEDGDGDPATAVISRRGAMGWSLTCTGIPAHSSQVFSEEVGYGAVFEMARVLDRFREELSGEELLTFNPGLVIGGTETALDPATATAEGFGKTNVVAATARVSGDLRTLDPDQLERARQRMLAIAGESLPGTTSELEFREGYPPLAPTPENRDLLDLYSQASEDLGHGPVDAVDPARAGAADISFCSGRVRGALCGLGLMGTGGHTEEETADLRTLVSQAQRAALLILRLAQRDASR